MTASNALIRNSKIELQKLWDVHNVRYDSASPETLEFKRIFLWPVLISTVLYLPICWSLKRYYKNRPPFPYRWPLVAWNCLLSILSGAGAAAMMYTEGLGLLGPLEFRLRKVHPTAAWVCMMFCWTKMFEYGDTFWLCVKKRPIIFLHLYHHITVSLFCLHSVLLEAPFGHYFAIINLCIHFVMYGYYALAIQFKGNKLLIYARPWITMSQLSQMFVGVAICIHELSSANKTPGLEINAFLGLVMYISYAVLFADFFTKNYMKSLSPVDTVTTLAVPLMLPLMYYNQGLGNLFNVNIVSWSCSFVVTVIVSLIIPGDNWGCLSPLIYTAMEAETNGIEKTGMKLLSKKRNVGEGTWARLGIMSIRFFLAPCILIICDSLVNSRISIRAVPLLCTCWVVHGLLGGAFGTMKGSFKKEEVEGPTSKERNEEGETVRRPSLKERTKVTAPGQDSSCSGLNACQQRKK